MLKPPWIIDGWRGCDFHHLFSHRICIIGEYGSCQSIGYENNPFHPMTIRIDRNRHSFDHFYTKYWDVEICFFWRDFILFYRRIKTQILRVRVEASKLHHFFHCLDCIWMTIASWSERQMIRDSYNLLEHIQSTDKPLFWVFEIECSHGWTPARLTEQPAWQPVWSSLAISIHAKWKENFFRNQFDESRPNKIYFKVWNGRLRNTKTMTNTIFIFMFFSISWSSFSINVVLKIVW